MTSIEKIISISSEPLGVMPLGDVTHFVGYGTLGNELAGLLRERNGFYAFESALHVFPFGVWGKGGTLNDWSMEQTWKHEYDGLADDMLCFAEDIFGDQFCLRGGEICRFDAETGEVKPIADSLERWAKCVLDDYELLTGYPLAHEWQSRNGPLPAGKRLMPKIPFVLGGRFELANLSPIDAVSGMRSRGNLARQIRDLPDGARVELRVIE